MTEIWNAPVTQILVGLALFYVGLKMFGGGFKAMGNVDHLKWFLGNPIYMFFGAIIMTLAWQSSSLSTVAIVGLLAGQVVSLPVAIAMVLGANIGTTGTIWLAAAIGSNGFPTGELRQIALVHTGVNTLMAVTLLPLVQPIARLVGKF